MTMRWSARTTVLLAALCMSGASVEPASPEASPGFTWLDVFIDSKDRPLAAWQVTFKATAGDAVLAGVEGGEPEAFRDAPYYDPRALRRDEVVIAAFDTRAGSELPRGRVRVARLHLMVVEGAVLDFEAELQVAATDGGIRIPADLHLVRGT